MLNDVPSIVFYQGLYLNEASLPRMWILMGLNMVCRFPKFGRMRSGPSTKTTPFSLIHVWKTLQIEITMVVRECLGRLVCQSQKSKLLVPISKTLQSPRTVYLLHISDHVFFKQIALLGFTWLSSRGKVHAAQILPWHINLMRLGQILGVPTLANLRTKCVNALRCF